MKTKHRRNQNRRSSESTGLRGDVFKLENWNGPTKLFRIVGWRDDYSAFFVLDDAGSQFVIVPVLFGRETAKRFSEPPAAVRKTRLLPPPYRPTRAEANLLGKFTTLRDARACADFKEARELYIREAWKLGHPFSPPEPWELIYGEALSLGEKHTKAAEAQSIQDQLEREQKRQVRYDKISSQWATRHGLTLKCMEIDKAEFLRRHGGHARHHTQMVDLTSIRYKMEFKNLDSVWLTDCGAPRSPQSTADLDQIRKLLDANPQFLQVTPADAEKALDLTPDPKHRTLKDYCDTAKLDYKKLTRADLPALAAVRNDRKDAQSRAATRVNKKRHENF